MSDRKQYQRKKIPVPKISQRGSGWQVDVMWMGERPRPTFKTEEEAKVWAAEQQVRMAKGEKLSPPEDFKPRNNDGRARTLGELYEHTKQSHWLVSGPNGGPVKSWDKIEIAAKQTLEAIRERTRLSTLTVQSVEKALKDIEQKRGNSPRTTNRRISALLVMFKEGVRMGWMPALLPLKKAPEVKTGRIFRITPALERDMLLYAIAEGNLDFYDFMVLSLYLGHRENETLRVRLSESLAHPLDGYCDGSEFVIFPQSNHKNKTTFSHAVPVRPIVAEIINRRRAKASSPDARILEGVTPDQVTNWFRTMKATLIEQGHEEIEKQRREGLPVGKDFCIHIMRSEFCSRLGDEGFDVHEIAKFSGHSDISTCRRYVKPQKLAHRAAALRRGEVNMMWLPGGDVPEFAPTIPMTSKGPVKVVVDNTPKPDANPHAGLDPEVLKALSILKQAGLLDSLLEAVANQNSQAGR
jgi:integrase